MLRLDFRDGTYLCMIHNNGITLDMCVTFILSNSLRMENLKMKKVMIASDFGEYVYYFEQERKCK